MPKPPELSPLGDAEKTALLDAVVTRMRHDLDMPCDCPLHQMTPEERTAAIDRAIDATNVQIRDGQLPEEDA